MDQSKANPVLYKEKDKPNRTESPRCITPRTPENKRRGTPRLESPAKHDDMDKLETENKRQEIVLNIPQQTRDEEGDKTADNSRATSIANLDTIVTENGKQVPDAMLSNDAKVESGARRAQLSLRQGH